MALTDEQIQEAVEEIARRNKVENDRHRAEYNRRQREAEERFWRGMEAKYPSLSRDEMSDIAIEYRDFFD